MEGQYYVVTSTRVCNKVCLKYRSVRNGTNYRKGVRYCAFCQTFMEYTGLWCPCCNQRVRTRTRNAKERRKKRIA